MKKLFALLAVVLAVVSCQKDVDSLNVNVDGKQETVVTVTLPEVTRAASDLSGWENEKGTLNVIFQVYDENGKTTEQMRQTGTIAYDTKSVNFNVRLVPNRKYTFVAWADQGDYFDTTDLEKVTFKANTWNAMSEVRDAYTATKTVEAATSIPAISLELTRPFAKVRVVTTDIKAITNLGLALKDGSVTYSTALPNSFNVVAGKVNEATEVKEHAINYQTDVYADNAGEKTLFTDYVLIPEDGVVNFTLTVNDMAKEITTVTFNTDIPVERNKLTTIKGNILTGNTDVNIKVEDEFEQPGIERPYVEVNSVAELQEAIENAEEGKETTIVLGENIDLGLGGIILSTRAEEPGFGILVSKGKDIILDLGGKTLSMNKECTKHFSMIENNGNLTITGNGKISFKDTGAGDPNFSWGSYTVSNYGGNLVIENGTIEHLGEQNQGNGQPNCHMYCAVFQYSGSTTINGGKISTPTYRSARLWNGDMTINGGEFTGQVWFHCVSDGANLTINNGTFAPRGNDGSSVFVNNSSKNVTFAVNGGTFNGKIGMDAPYACITGGTFTEEAKNGTNAALLAACHYFEKVGENYVVKGVNQVNGVYQISSKADLFWFANEVNVNKNTFNGQTIKLVADIDLNNEEWTPIGTEANSFKGSFDGNGKTIKNLALVESEAKEGKAFIGLFGYAKDATIKNVTFENVYINIPCLDIDHSQGHIGAVAGSLEGTSTIENVTVKGDVKVYATQDANGASRVAVIAGGNSYGNVTMKNVHVIADEGSYLIANNNTGALAGQLQGKSVFENCSSNINVTVNKFFAGGIIGLAAGDQTFTNCHTTGNIAVVAGREGRAHDQYRVGGIAGGWADGANNVCTLTNCSYTGKVSGKNSDGSVAEVLDYMGYVGRGYTLNGCQGSKVVIDGMEFVQKYNTASEAGIYDIANLEISNKADLFWFAQMVNSNKCTFAGQTVKLAADIDLNNEEWTPIGSAYMDHGFMGNFDGNGYTIKNLKITELTPDSDNYVYAGLFGVTEGVDANNENYIKNLTIENVTIATTGHIVAAAVAYPYYTNLENITVKGDVNIKGGDYTAGVLAYTRRCVNAKNIAINANAGSVIEGAYTIGGVISDIQMNGGLTANYSNFKATGLTIKGTKCVGGISGIIGNQTLNGATVKNVVIVSDDARKGTLCGSFDRVCTINDAVVENVTGADNFIGGLYEGTASESASITINGVKYTYNNGWLVD